MNLLICVNKSEQAFTQRIPHLCLGFKALPAPCHASFPLLWSHPGGEREPCVGVTELTGLSGLCLLCWLFPFPLFTAYSTAAVHPTVTPRLHAHAHTRGISVYKRGRLEATHEVNPGTQNTVKNQNYILASVREKKRESEESRRMQVGRETLPDLWIKQHPIYMHIYCLTV